MDPIKRLSSQSVAIQIKLKVISALRALSVKKCTQDLYRILHHFLGT